MGDEATELRHDLVERLRRQGYLTDDRVADAFGEVPRENFLPEYADRLGLAAVYRDEAIVTRRDPETRLPTSSSSQPAIMARMLEMLDLRAGQRVVEIGAGTGYNAALLDRLVGPKGSVTSVELDREVAARAREALLATRSAAAVVVGDGRAGAPDGERVDRIIVTASGEAVARAWYDQLVPGGVLVVPLRLSRVLFSAQVVVALRKVSSGFDTVAVSAGAFMALRGPSATGGARPAQSAVAEHADTHSGCWSPPWGSPATAGSTSATPAAGRSPRTPPSTCRRSASSRSSAGPGGWGRASRPSASSTPPTEALPCWWATARRPGSRASAAPTPSVPCSGP